jgi:predicted nucleotidyltransferase
VLVVGAACRDVLHAALGHTFAVRATDDVDLGIAVGDWTVSDRIEAKYERVGGNGIRYRIAGLHVDVMPFGEVEDPDGISAPRARGEDLVVFGFQDVFERAAHLALPGGPVVRIPQPAGYAVLKMRAWIDRKKDKDAKDLALCTFWYQESEVIEERLYGTDEGLQVLEAVAWDVPVAAARILGADVAGQLSPANHADLIVRWSTLDLDALARDFTLPPGAGRTPGRDTRLAYARQLGHMS